MYVFIRTPYVFIRTPYVFIPTPYVFIRTPYVFIRTPYAHTYLKSNDKQPISSRKCAQSGRLESEHLPGKVSSSFETSLSCVEPCKRFPENMSGTPCALLPENSPGKCRARPPGFPSGKQEVSSRQISLVVQHVSVTCVQI
jgi:hypothetical protein